MDLPAEEVPDRSMYVSAFTIGMGYFAGLGRKHVTKFSFRLAMNNMYSKNVRFYHTIRYLTRRRRSFKLLPLKS